MEPGSSTAAAAVVREIWRRVLSEQPQPPTGVLVGAVLLALALVLSPALWPVTRLAVTITHEGAHAVSAVLTGRRLQGIRLHSDTSGVTVSSGRPRGPGMVVMVAAGYLGPAVVGLGAALLLSAGRSLGLMWALVVLLAAMLLQIRNVYGFLVVVASGAALALVSWYLSAAAQSAVAYLIAWVLLLAAPRPVLELVRQRHRGRGGRSDADQLARLTGVPGLVWTGFFLLANLLALAGGAALLLPT